MKTLIRTMTSKIQSCAPMHENVIAAAGAAAGAAAAAAATAAAVHADITVTVVLFKFFFFSLGCVCNRKVNHNGISAPTTTAVTTHS